MSKFTQFVKHEFIEMLPPTLFFLVVFHVTSFIRSLVVQDFGITVTSSGYATMGALIVGKAVLIANKFRFLHIFENQRRIYTVLWKVLVYSFVVLIFQFSEHAVPMVWNGATFGEASQHIFEAISWPKFWSTHLVMALFLFAYASVIEVMEEVGRNEFWRIFLGKKDSKTT